jgi:hypothetical protein
MENAFVQQLKSQVTDLGTSLTQVGKLRLIGLVSRLLGLFLLLFTIVLLIFALLSFGAVACIHALSVHMPIWAAALIMGGLYLVLLLIVIACRRPLFVYPFIRLMNSEIRNWEDLERRTMEAEHQVELQRMRIEGHVESVTRTFTIYTGLLSRLWHFFLDKLHKA